MSKNHGKEAEINFVKAINDCSTYKNMNNNIKLFLKSIFGINFKNNDIFYAELCSDYYKPDIKIVYNNMEKYISLKSGKNNSIHQEHLYSFLFFLMDLGIDKSIIEEIRKYHFSDGSNDGSGLERKSISYYIEDNKNKINEINKVLNIPEIKEKIINRILFKGECYYSHAADIIYYGNKTKGIWAKRKQIFDYFYKKNIFSDSIHVSNIYMQAYHRNLKHNEKNEIYRNYIQFKWYSIEKDIISIIKSA